MRTINQLSEEFDYPAWSAVKFIESVHMTILAKTRRTWRERLFTCPWNPLKAYAYKPRPDPNIYEIEGGIFVGHPATVAAIRRQLWHTPKQVTP